MIKENNKINKNDEINKKLDEFKNLPGAIYTTAFNQWLLGGMMDSDGCFSLREKNYLSCIITVSTREIDCLHKIQTRFGGSISLRSNAKAVDWKLHKKDLVKQFLLALMGIFI